MDNAAVPPHTPNMEPNTGLDPVISELHDHLAFRRLEYGMRALEVHMPVIDALHPAQPSAAVLLGLVARWMDAGFPPTGESCDCRPPRFRLLSGNPPAIR